MQAPTALQQAIQQVREAVGRVIVGQQDVIDGVLTGLLAGGHVLLEGVPGTRQDLAREDPGRHPGAPIPTHPMHARSDAYRYPWRRDPRTHLYPAPPG